jgi:predicted DNA binding protein/PAS domain-containing protein
MVNRPVADSERDGRSDRAVLTALDAVDDVFFLLDGERLFWWNRRLEETTGYTAEEIEMLDFADLVGSPWGDCAPGRSRSLADAGSFEAAERLAELERTAEADSLADRQETTLVVDLVAKDGSRIPHEVRTTTCSDDVTGETYRCGVARDVSEWHERTRGPERKLNDLATIARVDDLLLEVTRDLFASATRSEVERVTCERLAASDLYRFAWVGTHKTRNRRIAVRASAGLDPDVETLPTAATETETGRGPVDRALRTGALQVVRDAPDGPLFEPLREQTPERDVGSAAVVPLVRGDATYGVLTVCATRPFAFGQPERAGFETLGRAVGFAIDAIENRKLLFADSVVELEFDVSDSGLVFVRASEQLECELTVTGYVETESGTWSAYLAVDGADPTAVRDAAADDPDVDRVRVVADEDDGGLVEFVMGSPALNELTERGAVLTSGRVDDGQGRFCFEAPRTANTRQLADRLRAAYPESSLIAQREFDRPVQRAVEMRQSVEDRLTDRQQEALVRAYHAGYFDWPRRSTACEVAVSMGIAETTFHYHLRNGLDAVLAAFTDLEDE